MLAGTTSSDILEAVDRLPLEDRETLIDILQSRLRARRRDPTKPYKLLPRHVRQLQRSRTRLKNKA